MVSGVGGGMAGVLGVEVVALFIYQTPAVITVLTWPCHRYLATHAAKNVKVIEILSLFEACPFTKFEASLISIFNVLEFQSASALFHNR